MCFAGSHTSDVVSSLPLALVSPQKIRELGSQGRASERTKGWRSQLATSSFLSIEVHLPCIPISCLHSSLHFSLNSCEKIAFSSVLSTYHDSHGRNLLSLSLFFSTKILVLSRLEQQLKTVSSDAHSCAGVALSPLLAFGCLLRFSPCGLRVMSRHVI